MYKLVVHCDSMLEGYIFVTDISRKAEREIRAEVERVFGFGPDDTGIAINLAN